MITPVIDHELAIQWAKTRSIAELEERIKINESMTRREGWRFGILAAISTVLASSPLIFRGWLPWPIKLVAFVAGLVALAAAMRPLQRSANWAATARYAIKLKSELKV
jgi:hypothetical protein